MFVYFGTLSYVVVDCLTSIRGISYIFICTRTLTYIFVQKLNFVYFVYISYISYTSHKRDFYHSFIKFVASVVDLTCSIFVHKYLKWKCSFTKPSTLNDNLKLRNHRKAWKCEKNNNFAFMYAWWPSIFACKRSLGKYTALRKGYPCLRILNA